VCGVVLGLAALGLLAWWAPIWWYWSSLAEARRALSAGRFADARQRFARLESWWPCRAEVELPLGICEQAAGRLDVAVAAWARIPPSSPLAHEAALRWGEAEMDRGRLAEAEAVFQAALSRPGPRAQTYRADTKQNLTT
jgi:tetratricopeptide (TPR) repeat protein